MIAVEDLETAQEPRLGALEDREIMVVLDPVMTVEPGQQMAKIALQGRRAVIADLGAFAQPVQPLLDGLGQGAEPVVIGQPDLAGAGKARPAAPGAARELLQQEQQVPGQHVAGPKLEDVVHDRVLSAKK